MSSFSSCRSVLESDQPWWWAFGPWDKMLYWLGDQPSWTHLQWIVFWGDMKVVFDFWPDESSMNEETCKLYGISFWPCSHICQGVSLINLSDGGHWRRKMTRFVSNQHSVQVKVVWSRLLSRVKSEDLISSMLVRHACLERERDFIKLSLYSTIPFAYVSASFFYKAMDSNYNLKYTCKQKS